MSTVREDGKEGRNGKKGLQKEKKKGKGKNSEKDWKQKKIKKKPGKGKMEVILKIEKNCLLRNAYVLDSLRNAYVLHMYELCCLRNA